MNSEVYDALKEAGASEDKARAAATERLIVKGESIDDEADDRGDDEEEEEP